MPGGGWIVDVMLRRWQLMAMQNAVLDTSPVIIQYDARLNGNGTISEFSGRCVTKVYDCAVTNNDRRFSHYGLQATTINYLNGAYYDYWNNASESEPKDNSTLAKEGTTQMQFSLVTSMLDDCYCIYKRTGEILFAGKNSIYYGHRNISELN
jgi:hypothetical protein